MARQSTDSILNSLKGRIWLAVSALAILNCICGLGAYLAVSFFVTDPFLTIFITFFVLAFTTMMFGWWLSNEVTRPIEAVTLLAKSLERSPSATLPRTTGSSETDELLRTLHRNSQQLQNLISLMDDVAAGKTNVATTPLENADRLSAAFQKLVSKVTDSISAKQELDELRAAVERISADVAGVRRGNLEITIRSDHPQTREITDSLRYLTTRLSQLVRQILSNSSEAEKAALDARKSLQSAIEDREDRTAKLSRHISGDPVNRNSNLFPDLTSILSAIETSFQPVGDKNPVPENVIDQVTQLRSRISETAKKVQKLRNRAHAMPQIGRSAQELARRSNLIALNTSIHGSTAEASSQTSALLCDEIAALSERSTALYKEITTTNETMTGEIAELENTFTSLANEIPAIASSVSEKAELTAELEKYFAQLTAIQPKIAAYTAEQSAETERLLKLLETAGDDRASSAMMRDSEQNIQRLSGFVVDLRESISDLSSSNVPKRTPPALETPLADAHPVQLDQAKPIGDLGEI
jgi:methyl-accepting chemotaxis protein